MNWVLLRAFFGFISSACSTGSLKFIPVSAYIVLYNMSPVFLMLLSIKFNHEKVTKMTLLSMVSSFTGCIFVIQPSFLFSGEGVDPFGSFIAIFSAFTLAIAYIVISSSSKYDIDFGSMHFFYAFFSFMYSPVLKTFTME